MSSLFPVYIYEEGMELPPTGTYFLLAGNGPWLHKDTGIVKCFVPVENISCLPDFNAEAAVSCDLPKIPARLVWRVKEFFKRVVAKYHAEAEINLYYSKDKKDFKIHGLWPNFKPGTLYNDVDVLCSHLRRVRISSLLLLQ